MGTADARAAIPMVHFVVPAPELHARPVQHAPLPRYRLPGGSGLLVMSAQLWCRREQCLCAMHESRNKAHADFYAGRKTS